MAAPGNRLPSSLPGFEGDIQQVGKLLVTYGHNWQHIVTRLDTDINQCWAKEWSLGCVISARAARPERVRRLNSRNLRSILVLADNSHLSKQNLAASFNTQVVYASKVKKDNKLKRLCVQEKII